MHWPFRIAICLLAVAITHANTVALPDDSAIIKHLRPAERTFLIIADRNGHPRALAFAPRPIPEHIAVLAIRDDPALIAHPDPLAFVPTMELPKPTPLPETTPQPHDLSWMFAHRFGRAQAVDSIPGSPVRSEVDSPFDINSGAFHGVRAVNGWSAVRVSVSIPCGVSHFVQGAGFDGADEETGYIYIGGWGSGPRGVSVDAGLQKSSAQSTTDDYAFYWKYASNKPITSDMRFPCGGPDVTLELYPVNPQMLVFTVTGVNADGKRVTLTLVQKTVPQDGWIPKGGSKDDGVILKRIVAIAQPYSWHQNKRHSNRFADGSFFGVNGPKDRTPRIVFKNCEIGRVTPPADTPRYKTWTLADTWSSAPSGTYLDWPPLGISRATSGACDAAGIYLRAV